ncbi:MAG: hypothetical protein LAT57_05625 [Balneolales bacterium]|nr:hypothetical protein [Balneolales bacterium]
MQEIRNLELPVRAFDLMMLSESGPRTNQTLIAVIRDGDVGANEYLSILGNERLMLNTVNWLMGEEAQLDLPAATYELPMVNLTNQQMRFTFFISALLMPGLFILAGVVVWLIRRKN